MSKLYIAEKPSVAEQIARALGTPKKAPTHWITANGDCVTWAIGHLLELVDPEKYNPNWRSWTYDVLPMIPSRFQITPSRFYDPKTRNFVDTTSRKRLREIKTVVAATNPSHVVNACDAGREGELIFRRIWDYLELGKYAKMERLWLSSMTQEGILAAVNQLKSGEEYNNLAEAAEQRAEGDWIVGLNGTRAATLCLGQEENDKGKKVSVSIGRVQTPTLAMIVDRDEKIQRFKNIPFWNVVGSFDVNGMDAGKYEGIWFDRDWKKDELAPERTKDRLWKQTHALIIADRCKNQQARIEDKCSEDRKYAPKLFDLTGLQRAANGHYGWTAKRTLDIAQKLYEEHKAITYPRTESTALPEDYPGECQKILNRLGKQWINAVEKTLAVEKCPNYNGVFNNKAISDHFAIIPTGEPLRGGGEDAQKLYEIIVMRFISVFCPACRIEVKKRTTIVQNEEKDHFASEVRTVIDPGWQALYGVKRGDQTNKPLPGQTGNTATAVDMCLHEGKTKPPDHFTEASLLAAMNNISKAIDDKTLAKATEERGLGTPATRAQIIETLKVRGYVVPKGKKLLATGRGTNLIQELRGRGLVELTKPEMTAEWEVVLKNVEKGRASGTAFSQGITKEIQNIVAKLPPSVKKDQAKAVEPTNWKCPNCGNPIMDSGIKIFCKNNRWNDKKSCWVGFFKSICKRPLTEPEIETLLSGKTIGPLQGLISKKGTPFSAWVKLDKASRGTKLLFEQPDK